jgi:hypothetical protein
MRKQQIENKWIVIPKTDYAIIKEYCENNCLKLPVWLTKTAIEAIRLKNSQIKKFL